jgi:hypothetical protein
MCQGTGGSAPPPNRDVRRDVAFTVSLKGFTMFNKGVRVHLVCAIMLMQAAPAQETAKVSGADIMKMIQIEQLRPLVEYCKAAVPAMQPEFDAALQSTMDKMDVAAAPLLERANVEGQSMSVEELSELTMKIAELGRAQVEMVRQRGAAAVFCTRFSASMQNTSVEELRRRIESAFAEYEKRVGAAPGTAQE